MVTIKYLSKGALDPGAQVREGLHEPGGHAVERGAERRDHPLLRHSGLRQNIEQ